MCETAQHRLLHTAHPVNKGRLWLEFKFRPQHQGIDKKSDQFPALFRPTPSHRNSQSQVPLSTVTMQEKLKGPQQHHEEARSGSLSKSMHRSI